MHIVIAISKKMKHNNGTELIKRAVFLSDMVIANILLTVILLACPSILPVGLSVKMIYFIVNAAMLVAQYFFSSIIYLRSVKLGKIFVRTLSLCLTQTACTLVFVHFFTDADKLFNMGLCFGVLLFATLFLSRIAEKSFISMLRKKGHNAHNVLFVGSDLANLLIYKKMVDDMSNGYRVLGYFANHEIPDCPKDLKYLGTRDRLDKIMNLDMDFTASGENMKVDEVYCSISHTDSDYILKLMRFCNMNVIRFHYVPRQFGTTRLSLKPSQMFDTTVFVPRTEPLAYWENKLVKRLFDIFVSGIACICMLPFIPIIALIIKLQSPGPIFFRQQRTGIDGKVFYCLKFRSMHVNKDCDTVQATEKDPRKFKFGNFMRKANIDEFPQFFNVLKGDMSIVGPRPHMLYHTKLYSELIDKYMVRHFAKPGITGWAQVTGYRGETKELWQMEERIRRDIWYIENWSFWLDLRIIAKTAFSIVHHDKNAY